MFVDRARRCKYTAPAFSSQFIQTDKLACFTLLRCLLQFSSYSLQWLGCVSWWQAVCDLRNTWLWLSKCKMAVIILFYGFVDFKSLWLCLGWILKWRTNVKERSTVSRLQTLLSCYGTVTGTRLWPKWYNNHFWLRCSDTNDSRKGNECSGEFAPCNI